MSETKIIRGGGHKEIVQLCLIILLVINLPAALLGFAYEDLFNFLRTGILLSLILIIPISIVMFLAKFLPKIEIRDDLLIYKNPLQGFGIKDEVPIFQIAKIELRAQLPLTLRRSVLSLNILSSVGEELASINAPSFTSESLREVLKILVEKKADIELNEYAQELLEKGITKKYETRYLKKPMLIFIPNLLLFSLPIFVIIGTSLYGGLSDYQKTIAENLFMAAIPLTVATLAGLGFYILALIKEKSIKHWILILLASGAIVFFIIVTAVFQLQVYKDWFSEPSQLTGMVRDLRIAIKDDPPELLFRVGQDNHLWAVRVEEAYKDKGKIYETTIYKYLSSPDREVKIVHSPYYKAIIRIEDAATGELIYKL